MPSIALLGAGFSRNWGGWLAQELLGELLGRLSENVALCRELRRTRNFEDTLAELQFKARGGDENARRDVTQFEDALRKAFDSMNSVFHQAAWHMGVNAQRSVGALLQKFDAIFTLNQDLLLELQYLRYFGVSSRWTGVDFPWLIPPANWHNPAGDEQLTGIWHPANEQPTLDNRFQHVFKLHGSVNWRDGEGNSVMVIGGAKANEITNHPILSAYHQVFREYLGAGGTRVMAIGYSFGDGHINDMLVHAARDRGMQLYLVNPAGLDVFHRSTGTNQIPVDSRGLEEIPLIGVSVRSLRESFLDDPISLESLFRFFA